ncbi:MAG: hypothetical protein CMJ48_14120 [Planctomycetaceae bacterium]|nr:hypothetical protein [Planctomycetaceae bacterium]
MTAPLPPDSKIELIESGRDRLVVYVPPGGKKSLGLLVFGTLWSLITASITGVFLFNMPEFEILPLLFMSLFWLVGLVMLTIGVRMRFTRLHILLDRDRLAIQRTLFGRKSLAETQLTSESRARLVESYQENDVPVYRVDVEGSNRTAKFGTSLSREEKRWFVATINGFLGIEGGGDGGHSVSVPTECPDYGADFESGAVTFDGSWSCSVCGSAGKIDTRDDLDPDGQPLVDPTEEVDPALLPGNDPVVVDETSFDHLRFHLDLLPRGGVRSIVGIFGSVFCLIWFGGAGTSLFSTFEGDDEFGKLVSLIFAAFVMLGGLIPLLITAALLRGRITVDLNEERLLCRWHLGPLGLKRKLPTSSITRLGVGAGFSNSGQSGGTKKACLVGSQTTLLPLTTFHEISVAKTVAGLVRYQLRQMGVVLPNG